RLDSALLRAAGAWPDHPPAVGLHRGCSIGLGAAGRAVALGQAEGLASTIDRVGSTSGAPVRRSVMMLASTLNTAFRMSAVMTSSGVPWAITCPSFIATR